MPTVTDDQLQSMVQSIENPAVRQQYEMIIGGQIVAEVCCNSKICKGRVIGHRYHDGQWITANETKRSGLMSHRERFDGQLGFRCRCGNDSIVAAQEKDIIGAAAPSKKDLMTIFGRVQESPTVVKQESAGAFTVDGFTIKMLKGTI